MSNREIILDMNDVIASVVSNIKDGSCVALTGFGTSMKPFITEGTDKILLKKIPENKKIRIGEIYLYRRLNGNYAIHRVYETDDKTVCMCGDAQITLENGIPKENLIAIATEIIKPNKTVDCLGTSCLIRHTLRMKYRQFRHRNIILNFTHQLYLKTKKLFKHLLGK